MVARHHPFARRTPTLDRFAAAKHALIAPSGEPGGFVDDALASLGKQRRVALVLPHVLVTPFFVSSTDLVLTLAERVARVYSARLPVVLFRPPLALPRFTIGFHWHERDRDAAALSWFRAEVAAVGAALAPEPPRRSAGAPTERKVRRGR